MWPRSVYLTGAVPDKSFQLLSKVFFGVVVRALDGTRTPLLPPMSVTRSNPEDGEFPIQWYIVQYYVLLYTYTTAVFVVRELFIL